MIEIIIEVENKACLTISELRFLAYAAAEHRDAKAVHLTTKGKTLPLANRLAKKSEVVLIELSPKDETPTPGGLLEALRKATQKMFVKGTWRTENWDTWRDPLWLALGQLHEQL